MRAYILPSFDKPAGLTWLGSPEPGPREVRVRVRASSVNPVDAAIAAGSFRGLYGHRFPAVLGRDLAGTVDAVGPDVTTFGVGDEVLGMVKRDYVGDGTFADYVVVPEDRGLVHRPERLAVGEAGVLGLAGVTALQCLDAVACRPGDLLFVNGATGGVGAFVLQMARAQGLRVIATARPGAEAEHVRALGATDAVDWSAGDVPAAVRALQPSGVDAVIDLISRDAGAFTAVAGTSASKGTAVTTLGAAPASVHGGPTMLNIHSDGSPVLLQRLVDLVSAGTVRVPLVATLPFESIEAAFRELAAGPLGKIGLDLTAGQDGR